MRKYMKRLMESTWVGIISIITDQILPFVAPVSGYLIFMVAAIMADSITGVLASLKENQKITSNGIWRTLEKIVIAGIAIMLSHGFETLWIPDIPMTKAVSAIIAFAELKSNMENYHRLTGVDIGAGWMDAIKERLFPKHHTPATDVPTDIDLNDAKKYDQYGSTDD